MEAGVLAPRRLRATDAARASAGPRIGLLFAATGLALFAVMGLLGIALRASQGEVVTDEDGSGAGALTDFLASKKFI